ncbi:MAG: valine--tRNA ligase [Kiritimatiellae bacterium]|nr:valine--tRNA ligase [Kiritimatiellia bacterium]
MDKHYDPKTVENKWYQWWEQSGHFHARAASGGDPYSVVIPPPNVTGILHMGHALNNTIQDVLVRWRRMQGRNTVWIPGTDHAGIATQNVVEKALRKEGVQRHDIGRDKFLERVWQWRGEYGGTIARQLRKLGASCDWRRERFTMDEGLSEAVAEVFCRLYDEGLIYRGNYIVNWCPRCHTALSDEESEHQETAGHLWHIRYPVTGGGEVVLATTRPETMLGDTAVAVNPADDRYRALVGKTVILPLSNREIPVVADDYVDREFGTGVVKITPAHDPNDFQVAQRHNLPAMDVMNGDGTMNDQAGKYAGLDRFECRRQVVADLEAGGFMVKTEPHQHAVGHCYRCDTVVEPRLSKQWFVRMKPLAAPAIEAVRSGKVRFTPPRWEKTYFEWMENIRDWCISRQIWWGHRIPVYTCAACGHEWAAKSSPQNCPKCGKSEITQDEDVLDTWFSSWLWPFSTFGWPKDNPDLKFYYPTHDLATAPEIIFFWVARMIMAGCKFMGEAPFSNVYIHGTVRDDKGRKMSKSLGNSIDPLDIIEKYSADALRFSLMLITSTGMDVYVNMEKFEIGRNFATKVWNAARFMKMHMEKTDGMDWHALAHGAPALDATLLRDDDRHMLARCDAVITAVTGHLENFRLQDGALAVYDFVWTDFCDWYLEYAKQDLYGEDAARRRQVLALMTDIFAKALKLLHPYMPFLTEELWHQMGYGADDETIMQAPWPQPFAAAETAAWGVTPDVTAYVDAKRELVTAGRALRADYNIAPARFVKYVIRAVDAAAAGRLSADLDTLKQQLRAKQIDILAGDADVAQAMPGTLCKLGAVCLPLEGLVDAEAEAARVKAELDKARGFLKGIEAKLANPGFVAKAPAAVIDQQREKQQELTAAIERLQALYDTFCGQALPSAARPL